MSLEFPRSLASGAIYKPRITFSQSESLIHAFTKFHRLAIANTAGTDAALSKELGVELWIKRDDCTWYGGNKRKLEFLMAEAEASVPIWS